MILWVKMSLISIASHPFFYHLSLFIFLFIFYFLNIADIAQDDPPPSTHPVPLSSFSHTGHQCSFCLNQTPETHLNTLGDSPYSLTHCQIHVKQFSTYPWEAFWSMQNSQKKKLLGCLHKKPSRSYGKEEVPSPWPVTEQVATNICRINSNSIIKTFCISVPPPIGFKNYF